jgi:hypothetical protein
MIFASKNKKIIHRVWAAISLVSIVGMLGFLVIPLIR